MRYLSAVVFTMALAVNLAGCGSTTTSTTQNTYGGPGSAWNVSIDEGTSGNFTITKKASVSATTTDMTISGTFTKSSTGFLVMTVTSASGTDAPSAGAQANAVEVPGFAFLLKPLEAGSEIIPMVQTGNCPTSVMNANWIITSKDDDDTSNLDTLDSFGTFTYTPSTGVASVPTLFKLSDYGSVGSPTTFSSATCADGILTLANAGEGSNDVNMWLTANGGAIVQIPSNSAGTDHKIILGATSASISSVAALDGTYSGLVFVESSSEKVLPYQFTIGGSGTTLSGSPLTGTDLTTVGTANVTGTFSNPNTPSDGFLQGVVSVSSSSNRNMVCTVSLDAASSGKNVLLCVGVDPTDTTLLFNALMVSN